MCRDPSCCWRRTTKKPKNKKAYWKGSRTPFVAHDGKTHRRVDTCDAISRKILDDAWNCLEEADEGQDSCKGPTHWGETGSVFASAASQRSSLSSQGSKSASSSSIRSSCSSRSSSKKQEAAVELATTEATLKADRVLRDSQEDDCCKSTSSASCGTTTKFHKCTTCYSDTKGHKGTAYNRCSSGGLHYSTYQAESINASCLPVPSVFSGKCLFKHW